MKKSLLAGFLTINVAAGMFMSDKATATTFNFNFTLDDVSKQGILDENGGSFGTLSFDEDISAGRFFLGDLTNVEFSFNMGNIVVFNPIDPLSNIEIFVNDNGTSLELTRFDDVAGSVFQLENNSTNVAFPNADNRFSVSAGSQFGGDRSFESGSFTAIAQPQSVAEPTTIIGLLTVSAIGLSLKRKQQS